MMKNKFYSYIDGFNVITVIVPFSYRSSEVKKFSLFSGDEKIDLQIKKVENLWNEKKYTLSVSETIQLNRDYNIYDDNKEASYLRIGAVVRTEMFEMLYNYNRNDLGFQYTKEGTTFKIWSPVAKEVEIEIIGENGLMTFYELKYQTRGVWSIYIKGDLDKYRYRYRVRINESFKSTNDPYGISANGNAKFNYVIDKEKTYKFKYDKPEFSGNPTEAVIYEVNVRDLTIDESSGAINKGCYLGLTENSKTPKGNQTGLTYIAALGITHIQLMPVFDFGGVDDLDKNKLYNWGYNPVEFNVPSGWLSENPNDPYSRINELKMLIDEAHKRGLRVIMDVVYNHVYEMDKFPFENLVPGYAFRFDEKGIKTEVSGCHNDIASEKKMVRNFILNSVRYWMTEYNLDGFRFDLMGLLDVETMNQVMSEVQMIDPAALVYGEGWNMPSNLPDDLKSNMSNYNKMPGIGFFNDAFRDVMKGSNWGNQKGYAMGGRYNTYDIVSLITGSCVDNYKFNTPSQSINYVECHDNFTFFDKMNNALDCSYEEKKYYERLATSIVLLSQGVPFLHAGQEFFRNKKGVENSYNAGDDVNKVDWNLLDENWESVCMVRDLIGIRKEFKEFRFRKASSIKKHVTVLDTTTYPDIVGFEIANLDRITTMIIKNDFTPRSIKLDVSQRLIFDGMKRVDEPVCELNIDKPGVYLLVDIIGK